MLVQIFESAVVLGYAKTGAEVPSIVAGAPVK
jgi:hypothetical protein